MLQKLLSALFPVLVLALLFSEIVSTPFYSSGELADARQISVDMANQGDFEGAISRFEALIKIAPKDQKVWADYIAILLRAGEQEHAWALADKELDLEQAPSFVIDELLHAALAVGDTRRVTLYASAGYKRSAAPIEYTLVKTRLLSGYKLYGEAGDMLNRQLQKSPEDLDLLLAQVSLQMQVSPELDNRQQLRSLLLIYPDNMTVQKLLAESAAIQAGFGFFQSALNDLNNLYQRNKGSAVIGGDLLVVLSWDGQFPEAVAVYDEISGAELAPYVQQAAAVSLTQEKRFDDAERIYRKLLELAIDESTKTTNNQPVLRETIDRGLASLELSRKRYSSAVEILQRYENTDNASANTLEVLASAYQGAEHWDKSAKLFALLMTAREDGDKPYLRWFDTTEKAVHENGITSYLESLTKWLPRQSFNALNARLIALLVKFDQLSMAKSFVSKDYVDNRTVKEFGWQASDARNSGRYAESIALYRFANDNFPANNDIKLGLALAYSEAGQETAASNLFAHDLANAEDPDVLFGSLYHYRRYGDDHGAKTTLEKLLVSSANKSPLLDFWIDVVQSDQLFNSPSERLLVWQKLAPYYRRDQRWRQLSATLLANSGDCQSALDVVDSINPLTANNNSLESAAFVARQCGDFKRSLQYSRAGFERFGKSHWLALNALVLTDNGESGEALNFLSAYHSKYGETADFLFSRGYAHEDRDENDLAVIDYLSVLDINSGHVDAYIHYTMLVTASGNPTKALELAEARRDWFLADHWRKIYADEVAYTIRNASDFPSNSVQRAQLLELAETKLQTFEGFLRANFTDDKIHRLEVQFDRIFILHLGAHYRALINNFDSLGIAAVESPDYIQVKLADAYFHLGEIAPGIKILESVLVDSPSNQAAQSMLFYSYLDNDRFDLAAALIKKLLTDVDANTGHAPWPLQMSAMLAAYSNDLAEATKQLQSLAARYPGDRDILLKQALIDRWRGWPARALEKYQRLLSTYSDHLESRVGEVYALVDQREYALVREKLADLDGEYPGAVDVAPLRQAWTTHNSYELDSRVIYGRGEGSALSNLDMLLDTRLFDRPFKDGYRVYGRYLDSWADLPGDEGRGRFNRVGAGIEQRSRELNWNAELSQSVTEDSNIGVNMAASFLPSDHWILSGELQTYSQSTPLRAINDGVDGKSVSGSVAYRWHESRKATINYSFLDFSDGNQRQAVGASYTHQVYQDPRHQWSLTESLYLSKNSEDDNRLYFNPEQDSSVSLTAHYDGLLSQSVIRRWTHRVSMGVGSYRQENYGTAFIWDADYEQRWRLGNNLNISYGVLYKRRSYDGDSESYRAIYGAANWRF
ncbi:MAG: poly-beta-1,6 N-acetyl-D-glucosamine export porin PgaA [Oceanicoccus sp.]